MLHVIDCVPAPCLAAVVQQRPWWHGRRKRKSAADGEGGQKSHKKKKQPPGEEGDEESGRTNMSWKDDEGQKMLAGLIDLRRQQRIEQSTKVRALCSARGQTRLTRSTCNSKSANKI